MVRTGEVAPDFTLPSTAGYVTLSAVVADKHVVLAFYTEDKTPGCTQMLSVLQGEYDTIRELDAEVIAIGADSLDSHEAFSESLGGCPFPIASDSGLSVATTYGALADDGKGMVRAVFVVDKGGRIAHSIPWFQPGSTAQFFEIFQALGLE
ncbi:MAG: redoxin domain-containing protein [Chloroflexi bacterium]|nr:redoxin domain-containing protein [Chloroflexota bacterium]